MLSKNLGLMLYVDDVAVEHDFWSGLGFAIVSQSRLMGYDTFDMKTTADSSLTITVYAKDFIRQVSPEVLDMAPSLLFESHDLAALHARASQLTDTISEIATEPFAHFNFANPSGHYFTVRQV